jgi:hypothetical protein
MSYTACRLRNSRRTLLLATGIVLLGVSLRMFRLVGQSLWYNYEPQLEHVPIAGDPVLQTGSARALSLAILSFEPLEPVLAISSQDGSGWQSHWTTVSNPSGRSWTGFWRHAR